MSAGPLRAMSHAQSTAVRELLLDSATAAVATRLRNDGVAFLLLKGPSFAQWLYDGARELRPYVDIDLLVGPGQFERAEALLGELGFRHRLAGAAASELWNAHEWLGPDGVCVDLHHSFHWLAGCDEQEVWSALSDPADSIVVADVTLAIPGEAARCLLIALHVAHHGREAGQPLRDLQRACDHVDLEVWRRAVTVAERLATVEALATGLRLCAGGTRVAAELGLPETASVDLLLRSESSSRIAWNIERFAELRGVRARGAFVARKLVPSRAFMRHRYGLADDARGPLVRAYLLRQLELAAGALPSAREWWRVRRRARR